MRTHTDPPRPRVMELIIFIATVYLKLVKKHLQENGMTKEEVTAWQNKVNGFYKNNVLKNEKVFSDWEFYVGAKMDVDGMVALLNYR